MMKAKGSWMNAAVVLLVLTAVYSKWSGEGTESLFKFSDLNILIGALLALVVLRMIRAKNDKQK